MTTRWRLAAAAVTLSALLAACGGGSKSPGAQSPSATGGTNQNPSRNALQAVVASFDLAPGPRSRFLLGLQLGDARLVGFGTVRVRVHPEGKTAGEFVPARFLAVPGTELPKPLPASAQVVDALHGRGVYEANVALTAPGTWVADVEADVQGLGHLTASAPFTVVAQHGAVAVGDRAPASTNPTVARHGKFPLTIVDSRARGASPVPDPALHQTTIAAALAAHRPIVIVVSTPVYCQSRFCGPITDLVADVAKQFAKQATFIHVEVWGNYEQQQLNEAAVQWIARGQGDANEPWVFVVGSDGIVKARFDNVVTRDELTAAINRYAH